MCVVLAQNAAGAHMKMAPPPRFLLKEIELWVCFTKSLYSPIFTDKLQQHGFLNCWLQPIHWCVE
jgi:hypothetical protein